ncbi:MAG: CoA transferase [Acidaminococcales bacterium]|jgi:CoA:oxalate CoA-transferase|nr:CoA transferase [Acidaminococcales bacterium]
MGPLEGLVVLDLTRVLSGPYATMMLADYGANVYKIEPPKVGDDSRAFGPFVEKESAYFMSLNRNKRSMVLDFKKHSHIGVFKEMVKKADVVVENYKPGTMEKFGLGYDVLEKINPEIIYAACSGFGHSGPYMLKPAYDIVVQAMGGVMGITGPEGGEPTRVGASIGDIIAGIFTANAVMLALYHRQKTGQGQKIDVSMLDCQIAILENAIARYVTSGVVPEPIGNRHPSITPFASFAAKDGHIIIGAGNDRLWEKMCNVFGKAEWLNDPDFASNGARTNNVKKLYAQMNEVTKEKTIAEWIGILEEAGVPCAPINTVDKLVADPQIIARDMIVEVKHPVAGSLKMAGVPLKMSKSPGSVRMPAPLLGQHTNELLREMFGWDEKTVADRLE